MPKYTVQSPIKHDGKKYGVGDPITLTSKEAEPLIGAGALSEDRPDSSAKKAAERAAAEQAAAEQAAAEQAAAEQAKG